LFFEEKEHFSGYDFLAAERRENCFIMQKHPATAECLSLFKIRKKLRNTERCSKAFLHYYY